MAEGASAGLAGHRARRLPLRLVSILIFLVLAGVVTTSALIAQKAISDQERLLLRERAGEAATVLGSAFFGVQGSLQLLGVIARTDGGHPGMFGSAAGSVTTDKAQTWLVTTGGTGLRVLASAGQAAAGQAAPALEPLARRALASTGVVSGLVRFGSGERLTFGLGRAAGPGTVVWTGVPISPGTPAKASTSSPWGDLDIAMYTSARPSPATLVQATTRNLPLHGAAYPFKVGAATWLLVASSPRPLVGSLAQDMPWIILAIGGLVALLVTAVVETLCRRRDYAASLVHQRTMSLRNAIGELQSAQSQLVRQEKLAAVGQLASSVGHELRNPLGVVMNVLYLMEARAGDDEPMRRHLATAKREVSAATLIVSDLLDYSAGRDPIMAPVLVADLVSEALSVAPPPTGIEAVVKASDPGLTMEADRDQIRQVLLNLISNGYDAMPDGGVLTVTATSVAGAAQITVTDTGTGMSEQTRASIFTPFFTSKARGIGLGLAVTKRVVEAHSGSISVDSAPSVGSSFTITIPTAAMVGVSR
jgi:signal transduction histidine kinase